MEIVAATSSTMDAARERIQAGHIGFDADGRPDADGILAVEQTEGRGQRGRSWFSAGDASLCATYYVGGAGVGPHGAWWIAFGAGVAVADTIGEYATALSGAPTIGLKWPNDVVLNGRKVAGILVEMVRAPGARWIALVGVGLNVGHVEFPDEIRDIATSLADEGITGVSGPDLAERLAANLRQWRSDGSETGSIIESWRAYDATPGLRFEADQEGVRVRGTATGVDDHGALVLDLDDGRTIAVTSASSLRAL